MIRECIVYNTLFYISEIVIVVFVVMIICDKNWFLLKELNYV